MYKVTVKDIVTKIVRKGHPISKKLKQKCRKIVSEETNVTTLTHVVNTYSFPGDEILKTRIASLITERAKVTNQKTKSK